MVSLSSRGAVALGYSRGPVLFFWVGVFRVIRMGGGKSEVPGPKKIVLEHPQKPEAPLLDGLCASG